MNISANVGRDFSHEKFLGENFSYMNRLATSFTKAETLQHLKPRISSAVVLPQICFSVKTWRRQRDEVVDLILHQDWGRGSVIVRSSAQAEDSEGASLAGKFLSIGNVSGRAGLLEAIEQVSLSYDDGVLEDQVFVQPMVDKPTASGVLFTTDPNTGSEYLVINYDEHGDTAAITGGRTNTVRTRFHVRGSDAPDEFVARLSNLVNELEEHLSYRPMDIEFCFTDSDELILLQVRPLYLKKERIPLESFREKIASISERIAAKMQVHPHLYGTKPIFGTMPDWNPAEIVGTCPRPLAISLYRYLITDGVWANQRASYGYRDVSGCRLLHMFGGTPFVDVRASFNSFIPAKINSELSQRLVDFYLAKLAESPELHDKIEFDIALSSYAFDIKTRLDGLADQGFSPDDCDEIALHLREITNNVIKTGGHWYNDQAKLVELDARRIRVQESNVTPLEKVYWLLEDAKNFGTLPFAGLARSAFVAVQFLRSMVTTGLLDQADCDLFLSSLETVGSALTNDFASLDRTHFLAKYGHLRPGTYDILSPRYDEAPSQYFDWSSPPVIPPKHQFRLRLDQLKNIDAALKDHGLEQDAIGLFDFMRESIQGREYAKFVFTKNLSDALRMIDQIGQSIGLSKEELSLIDIIDVLEAHSNGYELRKHLTSSVARGRTQYGDSLRISLPSLLTHPKDVWSFTVPATLPNFVTQSRVVAPVITHDQTDDLRGNIVAIPSADPGFDWIFSRGIAGFITAYGGANSHMAIRACGTRYTRCRRSW